MEETWLKGVRILCSTPTKFGRQNAAKRLADSLQEPLGERIGYRIRLMKGKKAKNSSARRNQKAY